MATLDYAPTNHRFPGKPGDVRWGRFDYHVTRTQKETLDGIWYMLSGLPKAYGESGKCGLPETGFYSQHPDSGSVIIGLHHCSATVDRNGRVTANIGV